MAFNNHCRNVVAKQESEITVKVFGIRHHNQETNFTILVTDQGNACGLTDLDYVSIGQDYRLIGRWDFHPKFGKQFKFEAIVRHVPLNEFGVVSYLSDNCHAIGEKKGKALWEMFGEETVNILRDEPHRVPESILTPEQAIIVSRQLQHADGFETTKIALTTLLKGRGFGRKIYEKAIEYWGVKAPEVIRRNPYTLISNRMPGAGFKRCDKLWVELGKPLDALKRQTLALCASMANDREGNTWFDVNSAIEMIQSQIINGRARPKEAIKLGLRSKRLAKIRTGANELWITLRGRAEEEERIFRSIRMLQSSDPEWPNEIPVSQTEGDGLPSEHQASELRKAVSSTVGCFTGGPGSGKTHTLSFLLREIMRQYHGAAIAVAAPTGKAAVRATESLRSRGIPIQATTIHQLLGIGRNGHDGDGWDFNHNAANPLDVEFLLIDESSMLDTYLMGCLLSALKLGTHVLFIGDTNQLPPVGHGAPFRDLIDSGRVPSGQLTEIRRNAGEIVRVCAAIKDGKSFALPDKLDLESEDKINVKHIHAGSAEQAVERLIAVVNGMSRWDRVWQTQIIVARNDKSLVSRKMLNQKLKTILNPKAVAVGRNPFSVDDKIICLRNALLTRAIPAPNYSRATSSHIDLNAMPAPKRYPQDVRNYFDGDDTYVANGEIGRVLAVDETFAIAQFGEGRPLVKIRVKQVKEDFGEGEDFSTDFDLGYAITVHKAQGSESPCIIVVADDGGHAVAGREWWYTAISRASQACIIIGNRTTVENQSKTQRLCKRKTFLQELLRGEIQTSVSGSEENQPKEEPINNEKASEDFSNLMSGIEMM